MKPCVSNNYIFNQKFLHIHAVYFIFVLGAFFLLISQSIEAANNSSLKGKSNTDFLQGNISENELIDNLEMLGIKCIIHQETGASHLDTLKVEKSILVVVPITEGY